MRRYARKKMNPIIDQQMEIVWSPFEESDLDQKLKAFEVLKKNATAEDLPQLLTLLESKRNGFWERELLSEPLCELGGTKYLPQLFEAADKNTKEGHDNDSFNHFLIEIAWSDSEGCDQALRALLRDSQFKYREHAEWLLTFCE